MNGASQGAGRARPAPAKGVATMHELILWGILWVFGLLCAALGGYFGHRDTGA